MKNVNLVLAKLKELENAHWFKNVGMRNVNHVLFVNSWNEALDMIVESNWRDITLEEANNIGDKVIKESMKRYNQWNEIVLKFKPRIKEIVHKKTGFLQTSNHDYENIVQKTVYWDMIHLVLEIEYSDIYKLGFFSNQSDWYLQGHFPCGWKGVYPEGKLVVY